jgi:pre-mRNA-splicing factor ISY1
MYKGITPDYYGFRDEDDGVLLPKEAEAEKRAIDEAEAEHRAKRQRQLEAGEAVADDDDGDFAEYEDVPTQEETTAAILEAKKAQLVAMIGD